MIKKSELNSILAIIAAKKTTKEGDVTIEKMIGLVNENTSLGVKRRLQKIFKELYGYFQEYLEDVKDIPEGDTESLNELGEEKIEIKQELVSLDLLEKIETEENYDWDLIEKISK